MKLKEITTTCSCGQPLYKEEEAEAKHNVYRCTCGFTGTVIQRVLNVLPIKEATTLLMSYDIDVTVDDVQDTAVTDRANKKKEEALHALPYVPANKIQGCVAPTELLRKMSFRMYNTRNNTLLDPEIKSIKRGYGDDYIICPYYYRGKQDGFSVFTTLTHDPTITTSRGVFYPRAQTCEHTIIVLDELTAIALTVMLLERNLVIPNICVASSDSIPVGSVSLYTHSAFSTSCTAGYVLDYVNKRADIQVITAPWTSLEPHTVLQSITTTESAIPWVAEVAASKKTEHALGHMAPTPAVKQKVVTLMRDRGYHAKQIDRLRTAGGSANEVSFAGAKLFKTMKGYGIVTNKKRMLTNFLCTIKEVILNPDGGQELCLDVAVQVDKTRHFELVVDSDTVDKRNAQRLMQRLRTEALSRGHIINPYARTLPADITWLSVFSMFSTPVLTSSSDVAGITGNLIRTGTHCYDVTTNTITKRRVLNTRYTTLGNDAKLQGWQDLYMFNPLLADLMLVTAKSIGDIVSKREDVPLHVVLPMTTMMSSHRNTLSQFNYIMHERSTVKSEIYISKTHVHKYPEQYNGMPVCMALQSSTIALPVINDNAGSVIITQQAVKAGLTRNQENVLYACSETPIVTKKEKLGRLLALRIAGNWLTLVRAFYKKDMSITECATDLLGIKDYKTTLSATYEANDIDVVPFCVDHLRKLGLRTVNSVSKMFNNPKVLGAYDRNKGVVVLPVKATQAALKGNALNVGIEQFAEALERKYPKKIVEGKYKNALQIPIDLWDVQCAKVAFISLQAKVGS